MLTRILSHAAGTFIAGQNQRYGSTSLRRLRTIKALARTSQRRAPTGIPRRPRPRFLRMFGDDGVVGTWATEIVVALTASLPFARPGVRSPAALASSVPTALAMRAA